MVFKAETKCFIGQLLGNIKRCILFLFCRTAGSSGLTVRLCEHGGCREEKRSKKALLSELKPVILAANRKSAGIFQG